MLPPWRPSMSLMFAAWMHATMPPSRTPMPVRSWLACAGTLPPSALLLVPLPSALRPSMLCI
eukprot:6074779-Prymnesium_polylepis.1